LHDREAGSLVSWVRDHIFFTVYVNKVLQLATGEPTPGVLLTG
jgi:hypothetical protein